MTSSPGITTLEVQQLSWLKSDKNKTISVPDIFPFFVVFIAFKTDTVKLAFTGHLWGEEKVTF